MKVNKLIAQLMFFLICTFNVRSSAQEVYNVDTIFNKWEYSCNIAMDSIVNISNNNRINYAQSKEYFLKYAHDLRIMAIKSLFEKTHDFFLNDINSTTTYLIEFESSGYCSDYSLYILKKRCSSYFFEALCASRNIKKANVTEHSFEELNKVIKQFILHGDKIYDTTCMITIIANGNFKSYPLLYFDSHDITNFKKKLSIKWDKIK